LLEEEDDAAEIGAADRTLTFRDRASGAEHRIRYPACLSSEIEPLVLEEYKRLAGGRPLTMMDRSLFDYFFATSHCALCRWRGTEHEQIQRECLYAGRPINFEDESAPEAEADA
jgi:hypothetical protein